MRTIFWRAGAALLLLLALFIAAVMGVPAVRAAFVAIDGINYTTACTASGATPQTCNGASGIVTSASLSTAAATASTYVINNSQVVATSRVICNLQSYSGTLVTNGYPTVFQCVAGAGTITINFANTHAANALSGTVGFAFTVSN
jgi:hypothetical protein